MTESKSSLRVMIKKFRGMKEAIVVFVIWYEDKTRFYSFQLLEIKPSVSNISYLLP